MTTQPLLEITGLTVRYGDNAPAVNEATVRVSAGGRIGLVGESGSGKSTIAMAILGLLPAAASVSGSIRYDGAELVGASAQVIRDVRWSGISMVFQNSMTALNPVRRIGEQIEDAIRFHSDASARAARELTHELLETVGLDPVRSRSYPHELSGGMRQRVMIALALSCDPRVVIADEPTTALDVVMQRKVLDLLAQMQRERNLALVLVSHDLAVVAETCDYVYVMSEGVIVEEGPVGLVLTRPEHAYTQRLIQSYRALESSATDKEGAIRA